MNTAEIERKTDMKIVPLEQIDTLDLSSSFETPFVIPTETVYGLASKIDNEISLQSIFKIKGRPSDNPLIVHISDVSMLDGLIDEEIPHEYSLLMEKFWPGPLTLLFKCKNSVSSTITGKTNETVSRVAIRMPKNPLLRDLIRKIGVPLAAPSANTSGKPSPTTVNHVIEDLGEKVRLYIDGGPCEVGLESTVFGIIDGCPMLLRPGGISKEEIENVLGKTVKIKNKVKPDEKVICPGQKYKHYSPIHPVYLFTGDDWKDKMIEYSKSLSGSKIGLLKRDGLNYPVEFAKIFELGKTVKDCSRNIFSGLRMLDKSCDVIFIVEFELEMEGMAIMDRIEKASTYII